MTKDNVRTIVADAQGNFEFNYLARGKYYLGFNLFVGPFFDLPLPATFYPGGTDEKQATIISLGENQKLDGFVLHQPDPAPRRTIEGVARWPDGKPAVNVPIELHNAKTDWEEGDSVATDGNGHFSLIGMDGQTYELSALINDGVPLVNSVPIVVKLGAVNEPVVLVIRKRKK